MVEPVDAFRLAFAALAAGVVVLLAACYAALLALGRLHDRVGLRRAALSAYAGVVLGCGALAWALRLDDWWLVLIAVLLVAYYIAPRAIWRLSVATHDPAEEREDG